MANWYSNKEFVSARAECQLVKDGVQSWEAVGLPMDETAFPPTRSRCGGLLGRLCEKKAVRAGCSCPLNPPAELRWACAGWAGGYGPALPAPGIAQQNRWPLWGEEMACSSRTAWVLLGLTDRGGDFRSSCCSQLWSCYCVRAHWFEWDWSKSVRESMLTMIVIDR